MKEDLLNVLISGYFQDGVSADNWEDVSSYALLHNQFPDDVIENQDFKEVPIKALVRNINNSVEKISEIIPFTWPEWTVGMIHKDIALDDRSTTEMLIELSDHENIDVVRCVAENDSDAMTTSLLDKLSKHSDAIVREYVAANIADAQSTEILTRLSNDPVEIVQMRVAGNSSEALTPEILEVLSDHKNEDIRWVVAVNDGYGQSVDVLNKLSEDSTDSIREAANENQLYKILESEFMKNDEDRHDPQKSHDFFYNLDSRTLSLLSTHEDESIRQGVAMTERKMTTRILDRLSQDDAWVVRFMVAQNQSSAQNSEILEILSKDDDSNVREGVSRNIVTPNRILNILSTDEDESVRQAVSENESYTPGIQSTNNALAGVAQKVTFHDHIAAEKFGTDMAQYGTQYYVSPINHKIEKDESIHKDVTYVYIPSDKYQIEGETVISKEDGKEYAPEDLFNVPHSKEEAEEQQSEDEGIAI